MVNTKKNLVMGLCEGYQPDDVRPFISSLKNSGFDGDIVFFTRESAQALRRFFAEEGVQEETYFRLRLGGLFNPTVSVLNGLFHLFRKFLGEKPSALQMALAKSIWNVQSSRYYHYLRFLKANRHRYERVILADVRDIIFQRNPFDFAIEDGLHVFQEYPGIPIRDQEINRIWIQVLYGDAHLEKIGDNPIVCSGVTLGDTESMVSYLEEMTVEISRKSGPTGFDQGVHNYLVYEGKIPNLVIHPYYTCPIVHIGIAPRDLIRLSEAGEVVDEEGKIFPLVHQYDRHPDRVQSLVEKFCL